MAKILIVEDDSLIVRLYQRAFSFEGYDVDTAVNGEEGLKKLEKEKSTLILLDIMMPKLDGLGFLKKLKANPETKAIPVVVLTNLAGQKDAEKALALGAVRYIVKSDYDPKQVVDIVKEILSGYTRGEVPSTG